MNSDDIDGTGLNQRETSSEPETNSFPANQLMLNALAKCEEIQKGMQPKDDRYTQHYLREARSGAMYGYEPGE